MKQILFSCRKSPISVSFSPAVNVVSDQSAREHMVKNEAREGNTLLPELDNYGKFSDILFMKVNSFLYGIS